MKNQKMRLGISLLFLVSAGLFFPARPVSAELVAKLPEVINPFFLTIVDGRMYIVEDSSTAHLYTIGEKGVSFVKSFGREGQGPGEFDYMYAVRVRRGGLDVTASYKLVRFTPDGEYIDEMKIPVPVFKGGIDRIGPNFLVGNYEIDPAYTAKTIKLYDGNFKLIKEIGIRKDPMGFEKINPAPDYLTFRIAGDEMFIVDTTKATTVTICDPNGNQKKEMRLPLEPAKMTAALKEAILKPMKEGWGQRPGWNEFEKRLVFADYAPGLDYFDIVDGKFVVRTYRYEGESVEFAFFDRDGKDLKRTFLPFTGRLSNGIHFCFYQGRYYYLRENIDEEGWELHSVKVW